MPERLEPDSKSDNNDKNTRGLGLYRKTHTLWFKTITYIIIIVFTWQQIAWADGTPDFQPRKDETIDSSFRTQEEIQKAYEEKLRLIQTKQDIEDAIQQAPTADENEIINPDGTITVENLITGTYYTYDPNDNIEECKSK